MRKKRKGAVFLCAAALLLCLAGTLMYTAVFVWRDDTTPPVITMDSDTLEASVTATDAELLAGVTAMDNRDGDVTADILVEGVSNLAGDTVTVTYAAFDAAGNVTKATRTLRYTDYKPPRFALNSALVFNASTSLDVLGKFRVTDVIDGDIGDRVKATLVSDTGGLSNPGVHEVEFRVSNSLGDTAYLTLPVDVLNAGQYNASVQLSSYLVYLSKGGDFDPEDYLKGLDTGMDQITVKSGSGLRVDMESNVDTDVPGVYSVRYTVAYSRGATEYVGYTRLNVVVEE